MSRSPLWPGRLAFGMQLPIQSQSTIYTQEWEADAGAAELRAVALACDEASFGYVAVCDHVAIPDDRVEAMSATWYDTVSTLSWIAGFTSSVRLLSHVYVAAYRHPAVAAKAWTTLDHLSGGRAILGVGVGHVEGEFELLGVDFGRRGRLTDESIESLRTWFRSGTSDGFTMRPRPDQPDGPPIWIGGSSDAALARVARCGDGWLPQGTPYDEMPAAIERIAELQAEVHGGAHPIDVGMITAFLYVGEADFGLPPGSFSGDPDRIARGLDRLRQLGATHLQVRFAGRSAGEVVDQIGRFGTEVVPQLVP